VRLHISITAQGDFRKRDRWSARAAILFVFSAEHETRTRSSWVIRHWKYKPALAERHRGRQAKPTPTSSYDLKKVGR
jgi:hypothetical protein